MCLGPTMQQGIMFREFPGLQYTARWLPCQLLFVIGVTLIVKIIIAVSNPASHHMVWMQKYIELGLPDYRY